MVVAADSKVAVEAASSLLLEASLLLLVLLDSLALADVLTRSRGLCKLRRRSVVLCRSEFCSWFV
jgi:hypothetical protein